MVSLVMLTAIVGGVAIAVAVLVGLLVAQAFRMLDSPLSDHLGREQKLSVLRKRARASARQQYDRMPRRGPQNVG